MNDHSNEQWEITAHKANEEQYYCWFESDENLPEEVEDLIEDIEALFFKKDRARNGDITQNLPIEGEYSHDPITIGVVKFQSATSTPKFELDIETGYKQLDEYGYC